MADKQLEAAKDGRESVTVAENEAVCTQTSKRCSSTRSNTDPPHKTPRIDPTSPTIQSLDEGEGRSVTDKQEPQTENTEESSSVSSNAQRKSWRRATITRRSLPALPNPYQVLARNISTSLSPQERLEKLMHAAMKLAIERTQNSLQSVPNASMETFLKQVEHIQKEWGYLAKSINSEPPCHQHTASADSSCDPAVQKAMENVQKAINRLQTESESWESLLNKHRSKAEELERKIEQGQDRGVPLDPLCVAHSSQHLLIQSKPNYHSLLCRQQPMLQTIAMIMDTQCKMVRELLSIKEQSQLLVKETSSRLVAEAGFQDLSPDPVRKLMAVPLSSATT